MSDRLGTVVDGGLGALGPPGARKAEVTARIAPANAMLLKHAEILSFSSVSSDADGDRLFQRIFGVNPCRRADPVLAWRLLWRNVFRPLPYRD